MSEKITELQITKKIVKITNDLKMTDIKVYNVKKSSALFDYVVIATCNNSRQAYAAERDISKAGIRVNCEGKRAQEWILADCGSVILHMMLPKIRMYYNLEEIYYGDEIDVFNIDKTSEKIVTKVKNKKDVKPKVDVKVKKKAVTKKEITTKKSPSKLKVGEKIEAKTSKKTPDKKVEVKTVKKDFKTSSNKAVIKPKAKVLIKAPSKLLKTNSTKIPLKAKVKKK